MLLNLFESIKKKTHTKQTNDEEKIIKHDSLYVVRNICGGYLTIWAWFKGKKVKSQSLVLSFYNMVFMKQLSDSM